MTDSAGAIRGFRWNLPNTLTIGRVLAVPVIVVLLSLAPAVPGSGGGIWFTATLILTLMAGITDTLDGYFARKYGEVTRFGKFSDPVADKLLTTAVFVLLATRGEIPGWIVVFILSREFAVMALRMILATEKITLPVSRWAKIKTIFQVVAMVVVLIHLSLRELAGGGYLVIPLSVVQYFTTLSVAAVYVALLLTVVTGWQYFRASWCTLDVAPKEAEDVL
jgi:CDP-diacylglycerol--glycerol-3-phosphate 3-phosphatidyltransferase